MQWNSDTNAGFSTSRTPWLPVAPGYMTKNAAREVKDKDSLLNYYRALIRLRKTNVALREGSFELVNTKDAKVLSFVRRSPDGSAALVILNCTSAAQTLSVVGLRETRGTTLLSSFQSQGQPVNLKTIGLPPYGALIVQLSSR
jgi:glycosidase